MKIKDVVTVVVAVAVIGVCGYFAVNMLFPKKDTSNLESTEAQKIERVPLEIDETTYKAVQSLSDYGQPDLSGLGKADLFK